MTLDASLLAQTVSVVRVSAGTEDAYGNASAALAPAVDTQARMWQASSTEVTQGRDVAAETWRVILPVDVEIDAGDRVVWDAKTFNVVGAPSKVYDASSVHHLEAELHYAGPVT